METNLFEQPETIVQPKTTRKMKHIKTVEWKFRDVALDYPGLNSVKITSPGDVYKQFKFLFENQVHELFYVFWLRSNNTVMGYELISQGSLNASVVHPREIFRGAIVATCASIIIAHNHPSGNTEPSNEDMQITKKIVEAGKILDIPVFDHLIFTNTHYKSFVESRLM